MRWENLTVESGSGPADAALFGADAVTTRTFDSTKIHKGTVPDALILPLLEVAQQGAGSAKTTAQSPCGTRRHRGAKRPGVAHRAAEKLRRFQR